VKSYLMVDGVQRNITFSLVDYLSQPALMILAAPVLLRRLGIEQYGAWMYVNTIIALTYGLGAGFADAATRYVSLYRGRGDRKGVARSLAAALVINCLLGFLLVVVLEISAPALIDHSLKVQQLSRNQLIVAVRIGGVVLWFRLVEVVVIAAVRAFERYAPAVMVSVLIRASIILCSVVLAVRGFGLVAIMLGTLVITAISLLGQMSVASRIVGYSRVSMHELLATLKEIAHFGGYTWLRSVTGTVFGYGDRLIVAALLGAGSLAYYSLCNQVTQPIPAAAAAAFNFLFPTISSRMAAGRTREAKSIYDRAVAFNSAIVIVLFFLTLVIGGEALTVWLGRDVAERCRWLLVIMMAANGLLALGVVPHYAALALGRSRALAMLSIIAGVLSVATGYVLTKDLGLIGSVFGKALAAIASLATFAIARSAFHSSCEIDECVVGPATVADELLPAK